jgi:hypothetical protein
MVEKGTIKLIIFALVLLMICNSIAIIVTYFIYKIYF